VRTTGTFIRKSDATAAAREQERLLKRGEWIDPLRGRLPLGDYATDYMGTVVDQDASTRLGRDSYLRNHLLPAFGDKPLCQITTPDVRHWVADLSEVLAPPTVGDVYRLFARIMRQAVEDEYLMKSPCDARITLPENKRSRKADRWLTVPQLESLADAIEHRFRCVVLLMGYAGLRFGEVAGLTLDRVDLLHGQIVVRQSLQELAGKLKLKHPKTEASGRELTLPSFLVEELREHVERFPAAPYAVETEAGVIDDHAGPQSVRFLFSGRDGAPLRKTWNRRHFRTAAESAGLLAGPPRLRPHHLRHTCASLLIDRGAHAKDIQEWLGHSSFQVTMDVYGHRFPERQDALAKALDDYRREAATGTDNLRPLK
jgi:integrase